jgi:transcriptional regulator with XRE-family HTH domain
MPRPSIRDPKKDPRALLGRALKRLRLAAGYTTQAALAARLDGHGEDSVQKAETGYQLPSDDLVLRWLDACNATGLDRELVGDLVEHAREGSSGIRAFFEKYATAEQKAAFLRIWGLQLIPGPLQTREYAEALFQTGGLDEDETAEQTDLRMKRQAKVNGPDAAHITALIYESALHLLVGTPQTMATQLERLLELSRRRNLVIQVVPDTGSYFPGLDGPFAIASGPDIADTVDVVAVEDHVQDDPAAAARIIALFEEIRSYARNAAESRAVMTEALHTWNSQQQAPAGASPATATAAGTTA